MRGVQAKAKDGSVTTTLTLEARPLIPPELSRLNDLAGNLAYAWDRDIRRVFWRLDHRLWIECENNPKLVLRRVSQAVLQQVANDRDFLEDYPRALTRSEERGVGKEGDSTFRSRWSPYD